jgi:hypothetical protein
VKTLLAFVICLIPQLSPAYPGGLYSPDGASSPINIAYDQTGIPGNWRIEEQGVGRDWVVDGLAGHNLPTTVYTTTGAIQVRPLDWAVKVFTWGLKHQQFNGSYSCNDPYHSTSFFVEKLSYAILLLEKSPFATEYASFITSANRLNYKTARWMSLPSVYNTYKGEEAQYGHRYWLDGAAVLLTEVLNPDAMNPGANLLKQAYLFFDNGFSAQLPNGVNVEDGGYDSSYQGVGLYFATVAYNYIPRLTPLDATEKSKMYRMLSLGEAWEASRIESDGTVNLSGNTRVTSNCTETDPNGNCKTVAWSSIADSFGNWSVISGGKHYADLAALVRIEYTE